MGFDKNINYDLGDIMFYYNFSNKIYEGTPYMTDDTSIIFKYSNETDLLLDYTISLGGSSRYLMDLSHKTGRCGPLRCFMAGVKVIQEELKIPQSRRGELYFKSTKEMTQYSGTMYMTFKDTCYYDEKNNILCIGNLSQEGEIIEFVRNTYAVVNRNDLVAVFMKVDCLKENIAIRKGQMYQKLN